MAGASRSSAPGDAGCAGGAADGGWIKAEDAGELSDAIGFSARSSTGCRWSTTADAQPALRPEELENVAQLHGLSKARAFARTCSSLRLPGLLPSMPH
jgi:hypothetical protein